MINNKTILKNAFIDSQLIGYSVKEHKFSSEFDFKMKNLIKSQKGFARLVNTTAKKVVSVLIAVLICLTTAACSIKEVREPIIEEIQKFFVNAKELLSGTSADEVSEFFPTDVTKIVGTSYISESKKQYVIDEQEKVTDFVELLSTAYFGEPKYFEKFDEVNTYWTFDFYDSNDKSVLKIKMCNDTNYVRSKIAIIKENEEKYFYISNQIYREILAFTNKALYLHDSKLERPNNEFFENYKQKSLNNIDEATSKEIRKTIRNMHYEIEIFLSQNVSLLKESDSIYWEYVLSGETFTDPIAFYEKKYEVNSTVTEGLEYIISVIEDKRSNQDIKQALKLWQKALKQHDLEGMFKVHEYIHDYDYFVFNFPTRYVYDERADYQGIDDYFGTLEN